MKINPHIQIYKIFKNCIKINKLKRETAHTVGGRSICPTHVNRDYFHEG